MRLTIVGNSGSGKSTLARRIAAEQEIDVLDLDTVAWEPGPARALRSTAAASADVRAFCEARDAWIVEGCYAGLVEATLGYLPELVFMDPGLETCLANCRARPWEPHKYASKAEQDANLGFLLEWVADYYSREGDLSFASHVELFESYAGSKRRVRSIGGP